MFFLNGLVCAAYIVSLPALKSAHGLSDSGIGLVSLVFALSALVAMQAAGRLVSAVGSGAVLRRSLLTMPPLLVALGFVPGFGWLLAVVTVFGLVHGTTDAAMNAHAVGVERRTDRRVLGSCHAAWSVSAVAASLAMGAMAAAAMDLPARCAVVAVVALTGGLFAMRHLRQPRPDDRERAPDVAPPRRRVRWSRNTVLLGLTAAVLMVCEGGVLGWGGVLLHDARGASLTLSAGALTGYALGQTVGRTLGDAAATRWGARSVFAIGGALGIAGLAVGIGASEPLAAIGGFAVGGLGLSVQLPLLFSEVGRAASDDASAAVAVARFTSFAYMGILLGPGLIGTMADMIGLVSTMSALVPLLTIATAVTVGFSLRRR
ncbi:MFS transporter [Glycomyces tenuis]|uniref:MFS transporter n=1 Tax=Glycomyces tenuis TaxID=58116 RepID=UPI000420D002|nr:MFS transporter [Glycomyces tenuis]